MIIGEFGPFVWLTYLGSGFAVLGIHAFSTGQMSLGFRYFILATLCDLFDGPIAKMTKRNPSQEIFGQEIDSLCDMVTYAFLPATIILNLSVGLSFRLVLAIIWVLSIVTRLAHFNRMDRLSKEKLTYFEGLPAAYAGLVLPVTYLLSQIFWPELWLKGAPYIFISLSILFVLSFRIERPRLIGYLIYTFLGILVFFLLGGIQ